MSQKDPIARLLDADALQVWDRLESLKASSRLQAIGDEYLAAKPRRRWACKPVLLAASVAAVAVLTELYFIPRGAGTYTTAIGEQRTQSLSDGTQMILNTHSVVEVAYSLGRREVRLRNGEAIFDVAPEAARPFVVVAGSGKTTALGTRFQVRYEEGASAVTLLEGSVRVARDGERRDKVLVPGQQAMYSRDEQGIRTRNVDVTVIDSWTRGRLDFQSTPLSEAVTEANRYSNYPLRVEHPLIRNMPVSGTFRTGDMAGMAAGLEVAFPIRAEYRKDGIWLMPR